MKKNKKVIILIVILGILFLLSGISYAVFSYRMSGSLQTIKTGGGIAFKYQEGTNALSLNDAMPMTDEQGKAQANYFEFEISGTIPKGMNVSYYVTARKMNNSSDIDDAIKLYLTRVNKTGVEEEVNLVKFEDLEKYENSLIDLSKYTENLLYRESIDELSNYQETYRLRMWIDYNTDFTNSKYQNATFGLKINVYSNGKSLNGTKGEEGNPIVVSNVASLKATNIEAGKYISTTGYYKTSDGGEGKYLIEEDNGQEIDNGRYIKLDSGLVARLIPENKTITVKQFGAIGDGIADDSDIIQTAFNQLTSDDIDTVYFPKGTYKTTKTIYMKSGNYKGSTKSKILITAQDTVQEFAFGIVGEVDNKYKVAIDGLHFAVDMQRTQTRDDLFVIRMVRAEDSIIKNTTFETGKNNTYGVCDIDLYSDNTNIIIDNIKSNIYGDTDTLLSHIAVREIRSDRVTSGIKISNVEGYKNGDDESMWIDSWHGTIEDVEVLNSKFVDNGIGAVTISINSSGNTAHLRDIKFHDNEIIKDNYSYMLIRLCTDLGSASGDADNIKVYNNTMKINSIINSGLSLGNAVIESGTMSMNNSNIFVEGNTIISETAKLGSIIGENKGANVVVAKNNIIKVNNFDADKYGGIYYGLKEVNGGTITKVNGDPIDVGYVFRNCLYIHDITVINQGKLMVQDWGAKKDSIYKNCNFTLNNNNGTMFMFGTYSNLNTKVTIEDSNMQFTGLAFNIMYHDLNSSYTEGEDKLSVILKNSTLSNTNKYGTASIIVE